MGDGSNKPHKAPPFFRFQSIRRLGDLLRTKTASNSSTESIKSPQEQQPQDHQVHELQQDPSKLELVVEKPEGENITEDDPRPPESERVLSPLKEKLEQVRQDIKAGLWVKLSIYRIPHYLKHGGDKAYAPQIPHFLKLGEDKAYVPQIVSLGPYYHGRTQLQQMEWHKCRCLTQILTRNRHDISLYRDSVKKVEKEALACYEGEISMKPEKFVDMMVLDGCFVIELFLGVIMGFDILGYPSEDPVFSLSRSMHMIQGDMLKLENQIPLFILDQLLGLQFDIYDPKGFVAKLAIMFFDHLMPQYALQPDWSSNGLKIVPNLGELHFLEVYRLSILGSGPEEKTTAKMPPQQMEQPQQTEQRRILRVTDLRDAGIKFREREKNRFWDIDFDGGTLCIPRFLIDKGTRSLFLNLIAFEHSHLHRSNAIFNPSDFHKSNVITSYMIFMDDLIDSPEDVKYLRNRGIIEHRLGSDAGVADLFNNLCQDVIFSIKDSYLSELSAEVKEYVDRRKQSWRAYLLYKWNAWIAILKHSYFNNPWSIISVIAAFVLLVLTFTQTFYGVEGYYRPGS